MLVYYLLYNIIGTNKLWIIDLDIDFNKLYSKIHDFKSKYEIYYIIKKNIKKKLENDFLEKKIKSFTLYKLEKKDIIMTQTISGCNCCLKDNEKIKIVNSQSDICSIM